MRRVIQIVSVFLFMFCMSYLINYGYDSSQNKMIENELSKIHSIEIKEKKHLIVKEKEKNKKPTLEEINPDYVGWLESEYLSLPVVQQNETDYLNFNFYKQQSPYGTAFIQDGNTINDKNIVIYGHNMTDGQMFSPLLQLEEQSRFQQMKSIYFLDNEWYVVCAGRMMIEDEPFYNQTTFNDDAEFNQFIRDIFNKSDLKKEVSFEAIQQLMTLSTCTRDHEDERFYVMAIR